MLWTTKTCKTWQGKHDQYEALLLAHAINELDKIDAWYRGELPLLLAGRTPPYVTKDEFLEILRWKMKRGDWREYNRIRIANTDARIIKKAAQDALKYLQMGLAWDPNNAELEAIKETLEAQGK